MHFYFGRYFLTYNFGDRNNVIGQGHDKGSLDREMTILDGQFTFDNS